MSAAERQEKLDRLYDELNKARAESFVDFDYICELVVEIAQLQRAIA